MRIYTKTAVSLSDMPVWLLKQPDWHNEMKNLDRPGSRAVIDRESGSIAMEGPFRPDDKFEALRWVDLTYDTKVPQLAVKTMQPNGSSEGWHIVEDRSIEEVLKYMNVVAIMVVQNNFMIEVYEDGVFTQRFLDGAEKEAVV